MNIIAVIVGIPLLIVGIILTFIGFDPISMCENTTQTTVKSKSIYKTDPINYYNLNIMDTRYVHVDNIQNKFVNLNSDYNYMIVNKKNHKINVNNNNNSTGHYVKTRYTDKATSEDDYDKIHKYALVFYYTNDKGKNTRGVRIKNYRNSFNYTTFNYGYQTSLLNHNKTYLKFVDYKYEFTYTYNNYYYDYVVMDNYGKSYYYHSNVLNDTLVKGDEFECCHLDDDDVCGKKVKTYSNETVGYVGVAFLSLSAIIIVITVIIFAKSNKK